VRLVADSHAIVWFTSRSPRLSETARTALRDAQHENALTVSVATFLDLWYVTQTTRQVTHDQLVQLRQTLTTSTAVDLHSVDEAVADAFTAIGRAAIADPWDRLIVATALALDVPLVTRDQAIQKSAVVETIW
jgi:PIN domain nuclease of toxin-antitoxin system